MEKVPVVGLQQLARHRGNDLLAEHKSGSLYGVVERLVAEGLIEPAAVNRAGRLPERTVYRVTSAGRTRLAEWLRALVADLASGELTWSPSGRDLEH
ncbi:PadR family transcriptional regulator [Tenggerimyces flavus]|uniref:PadR family transcriptional regulator n=1 Tax=Tenggerimyces flavus TaxID=1708749 RepID=A0ABV7YKD6_9ACTN|nr:PadR family transcriptional regulator [Tenggerimyces flavus]MBM7789845.1 DNA-binding PadR family transcriptional regulator [Tenggerimyces flavus]